MALFFVKNEVLHKLPPPETCKICYNGEHVTNHESIGNYRKCPKCFGNGIPP